MNKIGILAASAAILGLASAAQAQLLGGGLTGGLGVGVDAAATLALGRDGDLRAVGRTAHGVAVLAPRSAPAIVVAPRVTVGGVVERYPAPAPDVIVEQSPVILAPPEVDDYMDHQARVLRREVAGSGVSVERRGELVVIKLPADVTFAFDRSDIQPRFWRVLDAVARTIDDYNATDVEIMGHTDAIGSDAYNYGLSERRAGAVADYLADRGADTRRLVVEGFGKTEPIASNATIEGRAANRRVEIVLHPRTT